MTKVIIDGVEYAPVVQKKAIQWRAEIGGDYYYVNNSGQVRISQEDGVPTDTNRYLTGNYYQTEKQAEKALAYSKALGRVTHAILNANDGWEADWGDVNNKYYFYFNNNEVQVSSVFSCRYLEKLPYIKSKEIAEQIKKDHKEDLEILRNF